VPGRTNIISPTSPMHARYRICFDTNTFSKLMARNNSMKKILTLYLILVAIVSHAQKIQHLNIDSLLALLPKAQEDTNKIKLYVKIIAASYYKNEQEGLKYEVPALELAEKLKWKMGIARINNVAGKIYWRLGKFDDALKHHFNALQIFTEINAQASSANCIMNIGQDYVDGGKYPQALQFFTKALGMYEKLGDKINMGNTYMFLSFSNVCIGNYSESAKWNYESLKLNEQLGNKLGMAISLVNIAEDKKNLGNHAAAISYYQKALKMELEINAEISAAGTYSHLGTIYKIIGNYPEAIKNYSLALQLAEKLQDQSATATVFVGLGDVYQAQSNYSEALKNYTIGAEIFRSISNKLELSRLYSSMGICYSKLKKYAAANKCFDEALALSNELKSSVSFADYYRGRELLDSAKGSWESAYKNYKHYIVIRDSTFGKETINKMLASQMQYETEKKEAAEKVIQEKKDIRQRTIRNAIAGTLTGALVFLVVVYRQRNKISKARKRSDELLLNILPEEVAEELKAKGSADAKQFDAVTVMFTDFKGFTQISEKLTPSELVAEIDACFKAFDNIITKYNIEKIKTIGDAYMCAGGLPVSNTTHAVDVVNAAKEIQQFMQKHLQQRKNVNKEPFEIRIGIHTGPVVAGIVGVKKFAYDIWGDTVNIASRMESSGEAGKVNISGSTYELVKENYNCIYRGKIQAKNKGEIDMYFVETI
jgi:adenylate cyclase